jgi:hypothetical protein
MLHNDSEWLLFFYTVPAKPGNLRMKVWRRLLKLGAVSFKGSVYLLPYSDDHLEALHWLTTEVASLQGEAAFVRVAGIETMSAAEVVALFQSQRESDYLPLEAALEALEVQLGSLQQRAEPQVAVKVTVVLRKLCKDFGAVQALDFFQSQRGEALQKRLEDFETRLSRLAGAPAALKPKAAGPLRKEDYLGRVWVTRRNPFVDRMASAWLIRRFIDPQARFEFLEKDRACGPEAVLFDVPAGNFSHEAERCTFEVLSEAFGLREKALRKMAEMVHEVDLKDGKYANPLAAGVESILLGIRKISIDDYASLEEGIQVFERLYTALTK